MFCASSINITLSIMPLVVVIVGDKLILHQSPIYCTQPYKATLIESKRNAHIWMHFNCGHSTVRSNHSHSPGR